MTAVNQVLFGKLKRLRHTFRYSAQPVLERENVAEHSFWTAFIAVTIAYEIGNRELAKEVAIKALVHDIEECMTGDLVREMKYSTPEIREAIGRIELQFVHAILDPLSDVGQELLEDWKKAKDATLSGEVVALADMLCVIAYCTQEMLMGNRELEQIKDDCIELIQTKAAGWGSELQLVAADAIQETEEIWYA